MRALVSLALDGELTELEDALLGAHLDDCADCARSAAELEAMTRAVRAAPLESPEASITIPARRRARRHPVALRIALAAALATVAGGLGMLAGSLTGQRAPEPDPAPEVALLDQASEQREQRELRERRRARGNAPQETVAPTRGTGGI